MPASCSSVQPAKSLSIPLSDMRNASNCSGCGDRRSYAPLKSAKSCAVGMIGEVSNVEGSSRSGCIPSLLTLAEIGTIALTRSGWLTASSSATPPPMLCPSTAARSMPRWSSSATTSVREVRVGDLPVDVGGASVPLHLDADDGMRLRQGRDERSRS